MEKNTFLVIEWSGFLLDLCNLWSVLIIESISPDQYLKNWFSLREYVSYFLFFSSINYFFLIIFSPIKYWSKLNGILPYSSPYIKL